MEISFDRMLKNVKDDMEPKLEFTTAKSDS